MNINEIKIEIKKWSDEFELNHKRPPKGNDISLAPKHIKEMYRIYKNQKESRSIRKENIKPDDLRNKIVNSIPAKDPVHENISPWDIKGKIANSIPSKGPVLNNKPINETVKNNIRLLREKFKKEQKENKSNLIEKVVLVSNKGDLETNMEARNNVNEINSDLLVNTLPNVNNSTKDVSFKRVFEGESNFVLDNSIKENNENYNKYNHCQYKDDIKLCSSTTLKYFGENYKPVVQDRSNGDLELTNLPIKRKLPDIDSPPKQTFKRMSFAEKAVTMNLEKYLNDEVVVSSLEFNNGKAELGNAPATTNIEAPDEVFNPPYKRMRLEIPSPKKRTIRRSNQNFLKLNMKFKGFCPKATAKQRAVRNSIKRTKWNNKMRGFGKCFHCGEEGHYSNKCPVRPTYGPKDEKTNKNALGFTDLSDPIKVSDFKLQNLEMISTGINRESLFEIPDKTGGSNPTIVDEDDMDECLKKCLKLFGFSSFRNSQENVIRRICSGKSTLAVLPTGSGKSLCYQIPSYIFQQTKNAVALIVSPLISLMQDQLSKLPTGVKGITLNSTLKYDARAKILEEINNLEYAFILLSPEALVECNWITPDKLPPISFACIDEVHCLSDWSHHFRPSYLRVCKLLRDKYLVNCFLGLSATCSSSTIGSVVKSLKIDPISDPESLIKQVPIPENITISVSEVTNKDKALLKLLQKPPFSTCSSILIYCSSREETNYLSALIRDRLQSIVVQVNKKKLTWTAQAYHAGLTLADRAKQQRMFMKGRTRVLVATIAFGMGLDKPDIRAVIHYSRPKSFENYVQEVGRAGRDSLPAHALVLALKDQKQQEEEELNDLNRHTYANHIELVTLKKFIKYIFTEMPINKCVSTECRGHICGFAPSEVAVKFNIREETLMTLLCYLELYEEIPCLQILPANYRFCKLSCYRGPNQMAELSHKSLPVSAGLTIQYLDKKIDLINTRSVNIDMIDMWERFRYEVSVFRKELKSFEWNQSVDKEGKTRYANSGVSSEFTQWNWIFAVKCNIDQESFDKIINHLFSRLSDLENSTINDIENLHTLLKRNNTEFGKLYADEYCDDLKMKSDQIRNEIITYFNCERKPTPESKPKVYSNTLETGLRSHIRAFITQFRADNPMTGRSIASVLHGIDCPFYPSMYWSSQKEFWRSSLNVDFVTLMNWANEELRFLL